MVKASSKQVNFCRIAAGRAIFAAAWEDRACKAPVWAPAGWETRAASAAKAMIGSHDLDISLSLGCVSSDRRQDDPQRIRKSKSPARRLLRRRRRRPGRSVGVVAADRLDPQAVAGRPHLDGAELALARRGPGLVGQEGTRPQLVLDRRADAVELARRIAEEAAAAGRPGH